MKHLDEQRLDEVDAMITRGRRLLWFGYCLVAAGTGLIIYQLMRYGVAG